MTINSQPFKKFICLACGYIYDEQLGAPEDGLPAGTRFEDIPGDWQCPLCGVKKSDFEPYENEDNAPVVTTIFDDHKKGVVIVGAGLAGWSVVDAIRALDKDIPITLIAGDSADRYHKPMLSLAISQQKTPDDLIRTTAVQSATDNRIRLLANTFVTYIDAQTQMLHTTRGNVGYDDLVLAFGATPAYPPTIAKDLSYHINNLQRFAQLQVRLDRPKHLAVIGAGMVGTEFAEDLTVAGHTVSLIDVHSYPLASMLPKVAGERILQALQNIGIDWLGSHFVQQITPIDNGYHIRLSDADNQSCELKVDEVIVATGLIVDGRLAQRAGLDFDVKSGISVNPKTLQTNQPHIYALGDCININGEPCRYIAPHRAQATTIAHKILNLPHSGYEHKSPPIRLKNKAISLLASGRPVAGGDWQVVSQSDKEMILSLMVDGVENAKVTLKNP